MKIEGFDTLFYTLVFIAPGFVFHGVLGALIPVKEESTQRLFLRSLIFSVFNYAVCSWLIYLILRVEFFTSHLPCTVAAWGFIIFVSPALLGVLTAFLEGWPKSPLWWA